MRHFLIPGLVALASAAAAATVQAQSTATDPNTHHIASEGRLLFSTALPDVPGKQLVVVPLRLPPTSEPQGPPHRHPGSVYVYVTQGVARLGIEGEPVKIVRAGESFFEPPGALHTIAQSDSPTEPAFAIAVLIVPNGSPLVIPAAPHADHR